jgi:hypothetical protein
MTERREEAHLDEDNELEDAERALEDELVLAVHPGRVVRPHEVEDQQAAGQRGVLASRAVLQHRVHERRHAPQHRQLVRQLAVEQQRAVAGKQRVTEW